MNNQGYMCNEQGVITTFKVQATVLICLGVPFLNQKDFNFSCYKNDLKNGEENMWFLKKTKS